LDTPTIAIDQRKFTPTVDKEIDKVIAAVTGGLKNEMNGS
jgi:hypothetical protein